MSTKRENFFSLVPHGSPHAVEGEREVMLPGMSLEILATRKIRLRRWNLQNLFDPYWRLYCPVEGSAVIKIGNEETVLRPGSLYLIPPRTCFSSHNPEPFTKWYVHFILGRSDLLSVRVTKAMDFLQTNLAKRISAEDAARAAGVSVRNLNHLFRSQVRMAPMSVLLSYRLDRSCHLLRHTDQSIEQVAENCGFPNRYYFSRMLKQHRGVSPAAYRKGQLY